VHEGRAAHRDALMEHLLAEPWIAALCEAYVTQLHSVADRPAFRAALERHLEEGSVLKVAMTAKLAQLTYIKTKCCGSHSAMYLRI